MSDEGRWVDKVPFVPKLGFSCNAPATLQPLANRLAVDEAAARLEPRPPLHYRSPVRSPGYGTSTSAADHARRVRLVPQSIGILLCNTACVAYATGTAPSIPYGWPRLIRAVCRISRQDSSTCSIAPLRTRPAQNLVSIGAGRQGRMDIVCSCPQPSPDPPLPRASNRCQVPRPVLSPPVRTLVGMSVQNNLGSMTQIITAQYGMAGQGRSAQGRS